MRKFYEEPSINIMALVCSDVIRTSTVPTGTPDDNDGLFRDNFD